MRMPPQHHLLDHEKNAETDDQRYTNPVRAFRPNTLHRLGQKREQRGTEQSTGGEAYEVRQQARASLLRQQEKRTREGSTGDPADGREHDDPTEQHSGFFCLSRPLLPNRSTHVSGPSPGPLQPDQGGHPAALAIAPVGEKPLAIAIGTAVSPRHFTNPESQQPTASQGEQVALPPTPRIGLEVRGGFRVTRNEGGPHIIPDLEVTPADAGPQPRTKLHRISPECANRPLQHTRREAPPPGMGRGNCGAVTCSKQYRHAIRYQDGANDIVLACHGSVGCTRRRALVEVRNPDAVNLLQPDRLGWELKVLPQPPPILSHGLRDIPHVRPHVQRGKGGSAHTADPERECSAHRRGH
jgi:hypothetical protein